MAPTTMTFRALDGIADVARPAWDALLDERATPFVQWRWLEALEASGCASPRQGWRPRHLTVWREDRLVAAAPAYLKTDSDGDFSRDFDVASAAERAGMGYYPKLSITVPFTPVSGRRLLVLPGEDRAACVAALVDGARLLARDERAGAIQVLFPLADEALELEAAGLALRLSYQYHWRNDGYREPADFLARFTSKKRNQQRRERAAPAQQGITVRTIREGELAADALGWGRTAFRLHHATLDKLPWGRGWLNLGFYERVFVAMPEHLELVTATRGDAVVAGAFNVASPTHLFGRYWGCFEEHPFLHFNVCLYHSIDECIRRGIQVFEGGAGGEHKLSRGFEPSETWSAHAFPSPRLDVAARAHFAEERRQLASSLVRWHSEMSIVRKAQEP